MRGHRVLPQAERAKALFAARARGAVHRGGRGLVDCGLVGTRGRPGHPHLGQQLAIEPGHRQGLPQGRRAEHVLLRQKQVPGLGRRETQLAHIGLQYEELPPAAVHASAGAGAGPLPRAVLLQTGRETRRPPLRDLLIACRDLLHLRYPALRGQRVQINALHHLRIALRHRRSTRQAHLFDLRPRQRTGAALRQLLVLFADSRL